MCAVALSLRFDGQVQPEAVEQSPEYLKGRVALAGFNVAERVNRNLRQLR